jgi:hypothetical protein
MEFEEEVVLLVLLHKKLKDNKRKHKFWLRLLGKGKGKAIPLQAWTGPQGSRRLRLPDF